VIEFGQSTPAREATMDTLPDRQKRFFVAIQSLSVPSTHEQARRLAKLVARQLAGIPSLGVAEIELLMSTPGGGVERIALDRID
jgi:hypothetical protein